MKEYELLRKYEKNKWSFSMGYNKNYGGYYAQAWKDLDKAVYLDGRWYYRDCLTEGGKDESEALWKLLQRMEQLEGRLE